MERLVVNCDSNMMFWYVIIKLYKLTATCVQPYFEYTIKSLTLFIRYHAFM